MARPRKHRRVCGLPNYAHFGPHGNSCKHVIYMTVDEYETIRLIDYESLTQEECSVQMDVARTTVQAIYAAARKKMAECLVTGKHLEIGGGDVQLCEHTDCVQKRGCCNRRGNQPLVKEGENDE